jgi:16S rRNA (adenine1518-N6/adenine1519-N6)-dimethyltransferase
MSAVEPGGRPAWLEVRVRLEQRGFRPSRRLGQNFLLDENMLRAIVRDAQLEPQDFVLEVGPGCGFLTLHLARACREVLAVEIDPRLLEIARELCAQAPNVSWLRADALAGKHELAPEVAQRLPRSGPWKLVSNLPYSVSAPLCAVLCDLENPPASMTVLVQREVAERMVASAGSPDWGRSRSGSGSTTARACCAPCRPSSSGRGRRSRARSCASSAWPSPRRAPSASRSCAWWRPCSSAAGRRSAGCSESWPGSRPRPASWPRSSSIHARGRRTCRSRPCASWDAPWRRNLAVSPRLEAPIPRARLALSPAAVRSSGRAAQAESAASRTPPGTRCSIV